MAHTGQNQRQGLLIGVQINFFMKIIAKLSKSGFSLIETLIVLSVFSIVALIIAQSVAQLLKGTAKADIESDVRSNVEIAAGVVVRHLRNATRITSTCDGTATTTVSYLSDRGDAGSFSCNGASNYLASGSARLTSQSVNVTFCQFVCNPATPTQPASVDLTLTATSNKTDSELTPVTLSQKVYLRVY